MTKFLMFLLLIVGWSGICNASGAIASEAVADTIPVQKKIEQQPAGKNSGASAKIIKAVPKAKNQIRPKAIIVKPVKIKPVKIIKPKIIVKGLGK